MKVVSARTQAHQHMHRQLLRATAIQTLIIGLIAFYPLLGCTSLGDTSGVRKTTATLTTATPTQQSPIWSDEFNGPKGASPDPHKWTAETGGHGWGDEQLNYNTNNQNVYQDGQGNLIIEARRENPAGYWCWYGTCQYTSARITTSGHFSFTYGRIEARLKIASGQGMWPILWLLGSNCDTVGWPTCGEIDVMENIGREPNTIHGVVHGPGYSHDPAYFTGSYKVPQGAFSDDFHVFALQWDSQHLSFFADGINYKTVDRATLANPAYWVYDHPFHIILDVAVGGKWPGNPNGTTVFPQKMYISYVRFYANA